MLKVVFPTPLHISSDTSPHLKPPGDVCYAMVKLDTWNETGEVACFDFSLNI